MRLWWAPPALGALCAGVAGETHAAGRSSSPLDANMSSAKSDASPGDPALKWFQGALNSEVYLPGEAYRRNTGVYPLICYVNNISATLLSDRFDLAALFVARAAEHMAKVPALDSERLYYELASRYLSHVIHYIRNSGSAVKFDADRIPTWMLNAGPQTVPDAGV